MQKGTKEPRRTPQERRRTIAVNVQADLETKGKTPEDRNGSLYQVAHKSPLRSSYHLGASSKNEENMKQSKGPSITEWIP